MFHMMNEARILVGTGAAITALTGFQYSLDYAKDRPQTRAEPMVKNETVLTSGWQVESAIPNLGGYFYV
jgi:alkylation response protein AidB-like acyl-CoA dehydrogenase